MKLNTTPQRSELPWRTSIVTAADARYRIERPSMLVDGRWYLLTPGVSWDAPVEVCAAYKCIPGASCTINVQPTPVQLDGPVYLLRWQGSTSWSGVGVQDYRGTVYLLVSRAGQIWYRLGEVEDAGSKWKAARRALHELAESMGYREVPIADAPIEPPTAKLMPTCGAPEAPTGPAPTAPTAPMIDNVVHSAQIPEDVLVEPAPMPPTKKLVRIELHPNRLSATHAGDYLVPVYEEVQRVNGRLTLVEFKGQPVYLHRDIGLSAADEMGTAILFDVYKRVLPGLQEFVCRRDGATYYREW